MKTLDWKNASPELENLWKYVYSLGAISSITPLVYQGTYVASEFATFNNKKIYLAMQFSASIAGTSVADVRMTFYDVTNNVMFILNRSQTVCDSTLATIRNWAQTAIMNNFYFYRLDGTNYQWITFNGYKIIFT